MTAVNPTFNEAPIFCSTDGSNYITAGKFKIGGYTAIRQPIHFNGENGERYLTHGYGDRKWSFSGILFAPDMDTLNGMLSVIESYIDEAVNDPTIYHPLVDPFDNAFASAQVHSISDTEFQKFDGGVLTKIIISGIICGMPHDGAV